MSEGIKSGDRIGIHYTGRLEDGSEFDSSRKREPLEFEMGAGQIIPGLEQGLFGMALGEKKTVTVPAEKGYGPYNDKLVLEIPRDKLPGELEPKPGLRLQMVDKNDRSLPVVITEVSEESIMVDANHPLAGKELTFDVEIMTIKASPGIPSG